ncbi:hypothetical protein ACQEWB_37130 [Streptomyces sp. CA-249302]|uniref:hypothetical protein n=1 Tax=Streptomyces sp. CA-249302 TaxID=3240058 RepID=UPI003D90EAE2
MTAGWCSRTVRAAVFAAVCVLLAALGHVLMSGSRVPAWALAAGAAATGATGWCLAGRERGRALIVAAVLGTQTALHTAFSLAQSHGGADAVNSTAATDPMSVTDSMSSMNMSDMKSMGSMDSMPMGGGSTHLGHLGYSADDASSAGMFAAHLLAALLCGLWLAYGERAAFRILRAVAGRLVAPLRLLLALPVPPHRPRLRPRRNRSDRAPRLLLLVHAITTRGPPVGTAVA